METFEEWAKENDLQIEKGCNGRYLHFPTQARWEAWVASRDKLMADIERLLGRYETAQADSEQMLDRL